ncbi:MAG: helix-turn-helix domain-containing protein [Bdellovibrionaceae bacterium]|nr:helix-turn-helix domain-containing protein [Pseudobdellovibrionaceae bacterium]
MIKEQKINSWRLAINVQNLRKKQNLTQHQLALRSELPRSTLSYIESGSGNPSLHNLTRLALALQVSIEELLAIPKTQTQLIKKENIPRIMKAGGLVEVLKLFPDQLPGVELDRLIFKPQARMVGTPHIEGTKEYLYCLKGQITVLISGSRYQVENGEVLVFQGGQPHTYLNSFSKSSEGISLVLFSR